MRRPLIIVPVPVGARCCAFRGAAADVNSPGGDVLPSLALRRMARGTAATCHQETYALQQTGEPSGQSS
jgi:hypothetical protein